MDDETLSKLRLALVELDDELVAFTEHCAFLCEAQIRLLSDHPNLPEEVILGAERNVQELRRLGKIACQRITDIQYILR
jgi:hypothetical protein